MRGTRPRFFSLLISRHASCSQGSVDMPYDYTSRGFAQQPSVSRFVLLKIGKTALPAIKVLHFPSDLRGLSHQKYMELCISHRAPSARRPPPWHSATYPDIDNHDNIIALAPSVVSDGTVALRNASQHHTIDYKVWSSNECPRLTSTAASCRLRE